jgi:proteic killer suppression protein
MIINFSSKLAEDVYNKVNSRYSRKLPRELHGKAARLLDQINVSTKVETLKIPPSNFLELLRGDLKGFWSLRINSQWRIIFRFEEGNAYNVDIVDYH